MMMDCFSAMSGFGTGGVFTIIVALLASGATYLFMKQSSPQQRENLSHV